MCTKLLAFLLFACHIIVNGSSAVLKNLDSVRKGYTTFPEDHAAYKIYTERVNWDVARDRCKADGAHLAITDSVDKIKHINSLQNTSRDAWVHVGFHVLPGTEQWVRVDNDLPADFVPWVSWESEGYSSSENCAGITLHEDGLLKYPCRSWDEHFVCEIPK